MNIYPYIIIGLAGLLLGSFLSVVVHRIPLGESLWRPGSHCPSCRHLIRWYHNIPLWGFLIQKGECVHCREKISYTYPLIEITTAALLCLMYGQFGHSLLFYKFSFIALVMFVLGMIDYKYRIIPNRIVMFSIPVAVLIAAGQGNDELADGIVGFLVGGIGMTVIAVIGKLIYQKDAMGGGDIKLTALLGIVLGWKGLLLVLLITFVLITVVGWAGIGLKKIKRSSEIPMAPFFAAAVIGSIFYGNEILHWYFHQIGIH